MSDREKELLADRNRFARELADLRDEHETLRARSIEFAETCASHCVDRAAESVAARELVEGVEEIVRQMLPYVACGDYAVRLQQAVRVYMDELIRIEGL